MLQRKGQGNLPPHAFFGFFEEKGLVAWKRVEICWLPSLIPGPAQFISQNVIDADEHKLNGQGLRSTNYSVSRMWGCLNDCTIWFNEVPATIIGFSFISLQSY